MQCHVISDLVRTWLVCVRTRMTENITGFVKNVKLTESFSMKQQSMNIQIWLKYWHTDISNLSCQTATLWDIVWYHSGLDWVRQVKGSWAEFLPRNGTLPLFIGAGIQAMVVCCYWDAKQEQLHQRLACYMVRLMSNVDNTFGTGLTRDRRVYMCKTVG